MTTIHIIGIGAQTVLGRTAATTASSVGAGLSRLTVHPTVADKSGELVTVAMADFLPEDMPVVDRMVELALPAIAEAMNPLEHWRSSASLELPLFLGLPAPRPGLPDSFVRDVSRGIVRGLGGMTPISSIQTIPHCHASGLMAIERGIAVMRDGACSMCLAGGVDSYISNDTLRWLDENRVLRSADTPSGFFPGEGAGFCLLVSGDVVGDLPRFGRLHAVSTDREPQNEAPLELWGRVLDALPPERTIAQTICDINGQRENADAWSRAFVSHQERFDAELSFLSPAMSFGDVGAASGPVFISLLTVDFELDGSPELFGFVSTSTLYGPKAAALISNDFAELDDEGAP
jgi:3-oxoacyl-[acyl-carrier-protein] synthase I